MNMFKRALLTVVFSSVAMGARAQEKQGVTVEWVYSGESMRLAAVPEYVWTKDGSLLLFDSLKSKEERTFEKLNPANGQRIPVLDMRKAMENLQTLLGKESMPDELSWPEAFDDGGIRALYEFGNDIFVLELASAQFIRLTQTPDEEKLPRFSPDGRNVAYVRNNNLFEYDLAAKSEKQLTSNGSETLLNGTLSWVYWEEVFDRHDLAYWWSPDAKSLAFFQTDESKVSVVEFSDFKPAVPRIIRQRYPKVGGVNPSIKVGIVNLSSGKITWADFAGIPYEYIVRVKWLPDGKSVSVQTMNRAQTEVNLYFVDAVTGKPSLILKESDPMWVKENDDLYFLKNGKQFIWSSQRSGYTHLYRYDMNGKLINQITQGNWSVCLSGLHRAGGIIGLDEKNDLLYFEALEKSSIERQVYRIQLDGKKMQRLSQEDGKHQATLGPGGQYYVENFSNGKTMPAVSLRRNDGKLVSTIAAPRQELLAPYGLQFPEYFSIPTRDGFMMPAAVLKPKNFDLNKKYPVIIHVYGGPGAPTVSNSWGGQRFWFHNILLNKGYIVLQVDNRSATGISKTLERTVYKQQSSDGELNDLVDAAHWLKRQSYVDPERIGVYGWSGGGTFTLLAMTRSKEFKAGIAGAPVTTFEYYDTKYAEITMKTPQENPDGYAKMNLNQYAKDLHGRLLMVHGTYDDNVHPQNSQDFMNELIKANIQFDLMIYPMRKHGFIDRPANIHLYNTMIEFWMKNL